MLESRAHYLSRAIARPIPQWTEATLSVRQDSKLETRGPFLWVNLGVSGHPPIGERATYPSFRFRGWEPLAPFRPACREALHSSSIGHD
jgi:hypothetical protein